MKLGKSALFVTKKNKSVNYENNSNQINIINPRLLLRERISIGIGYETSPNNPLNDYDYIFIDSHLQLEDFESPEEHASFLALLENTSSLIVGNPLKQLTDDFTSGLIEVIKLDMEQANYETVMCTHLQGNTIIHSCSESSFTGRLITEFIKNHNLNFLSYCARKQKSVVDIYGVQLCPTIEDAVQHDSHLNKLISIA